MKRSSNSLATLVDAYQAAGRYVFTRNEALTALDISEATLNRAAHRLAAKRRLAVPRRGFFVIVPTEYRSAGSPPPSWFIDDLMRFHRQPYYVGLLSAAALFGAAHQQPQQFQVVAGTQLRPAVVGRAHLQFFSKRRIERTPTVDIQTETGSMRVSTPEATALDLVRYVKSAGHLSNVATVLAELAERLDGARLVAAAIAERDLPPAQRLGHLLDELGAAEIATPLSEWVAQQHPRPVALRPDQSWEDARTDRRWKVRVNETVEAEL